MNSFCFSSLTSQNPFLGFLASKEVHIWIANSHESLEEFIPSHSLLKGNSAWVKLSNSQKILRRLLGSYLQKDPATLLLEKTAEGKPFLTGNSELFFSMTHTKGILAIAFGSLPLGLDLEKKRPASIQAIAKKFFTEEECTFIKSKDALERFFKLWTAKEAALKADGRGITKGLRDASTRIQKTEVTHLLLGEKEWIITPWFLEQSLKKSPTSTLEDGFFVGALASFEPPALIRWYDFREAVTMAA